MQYFGRKSPPLPPHFQLNFLPQQHIYEPKINIYWSTVMSLKLKTYFPLTKVPFYSHLIFLCLFECHTFTLGIFYLFFNAN